MLTDIRHACRVLLKSPGPTAIAVLALALGIAATVATFSFVNAVIIQPLPYPEQRQLTALWETLEGRDSTRFDVAAANYLDWQAQSQSFSEMVAIRQAGMTLSNSGEAERLEAFRVSPEFFRALGIKARLGRALAGVDYGPSGQPVVVVSHGLWERALGADPAVVGRTLQLNGQLHTVVGVMPKEFDFPLMADAWLPLILTPAERNERAARTLFVFGRMRQGITVSTASAELNTIAHSLAAEHPVTNKGWGVETSTLIAGFNEMTGRFTFVLFGAACFVLLLAIANVANLQLARAAARRKEMAIRGALGGTRVHIARQFLIENLVLSCFAAVLGILLGAWALELWRAMIPAEVYRWVAGLRSLRVDTNVVVFAAAAAAISGVLCGIAPALMVRRDVMEDLKSGGRSQPGESTVARRVLVVSEVALAMILLAGAGLMVKAFERMSATHPGNTPERVLSFRVNLPQPAYRDPARVLEFKTRTLEALRGLPQLDYAAAIGGLGIAERFVVPGRPQPGTGEPLPAIDCVSPDYFRASGLSLLAGRAIEPSDAETAPKTVVLSASIARHYFPDKDPIGAEVKLTEQGPSLRVAGVVEDVRDWFTGAPRPRAYVAMQQNPPPSLRFVLRSGGDMDLLRRDVRRLVYSVDSMAALYEVKTIREMLDEQSSGVRLSARTMSVFACIALILAAAGVYALISYSVARRTQEIGVRVALGADSSDVLRLVVGDAARLIGIGLAIGIPAAFALERFTSTVLAQVSPLTPALYAGLAAGLLAVGLLAGYVPGRRACGIDPMVALRDE